MKNNNLIKNTLIICIIVSLIYSFFGKSNSSKNLDKLAYIMAIGIESGNLDTYKISFQVSTIYSAAADISNKNSSSQTSSGNNSSRWRI